MSDSFSTRLRTSRLYQRLWEAAPLRFSLLSLHLLLALACVLAGLLRTVEVQAERRHAAAVQLEQNGVGLYCSPEPQRGWCRRLPWSGKRTDVAASVLCPRFEVGAIDLSCLDTHSPETATALTQFREVRCVGMRHCRNVAGVLRALGHMPVLEQLHLDDAELDDDQAVWLAALPNLRVLTLSNTRITDATIQWLVGLGRLERLDLEGTEITDRALSLLAQMPHLHAVNLYQTQVSPEAVTHLERALPGAVRCHPLVLVPRAQCPPAECYPQHGAKAALIGFYGLQQPKPAVIGAKTTRPRPH